MNDDNSEASESVEKTAATEAPVESPTGLKSEIDPSLIGRRSRFEH
jgi:hypothetical protein